MQLVFDAPARADDIKLTEQPADCVVAGHTVLKFEKAPQSRRLRLSEQCHIDRTLSATEGSASRNHKQLVEIVQTGIAGSWVLQALPARQKSVHRILAERLLHTSG